MTEAISIDLRRAPLRDFRAVDLRAVDRDLWADEAALHDRFQASWAGLDDAAWHLPGAAPSDAGGPDWSLAEHVGHIVLWQELAIDYIAQAIGTGRWPTDEDYDSGDFDRFNERHRMPWTTMPRNEILARSEVARRDLIAEARRLPDETIRGDESWGWIYGVLHGHYLDHLRIVASWGDALRARQNDGDPFGADPRALDHAEFLVRDATIEADLARLIRPVPADRWDAEEVTPGWTLRDHIGHLTDWTDEGVLAVAGFREHGGWPADPEEGLDAWNERMVARSRGTSKADTLDRYDAAHSALLREVAALPVDVMRSPDGQSWTYDCLYGHTRKHLALVGPWCVAQAWPETGDR